MKRIKVYLNIIVLFDKRWVLSAMTECVFWNLFGIRNKSVDPDGVDIMIMLMRSTVCSKFKRNKPKPHTRQSTHTPDDARVWFVFRACRLRELFPPAEKTPMWGSVYEVESQASTVVDLLSPGANLHRGGNAKKKKRKPSLKAALRVWVQTHLKIGFNWSKYGGLGALKSFYGCVCAYFTYNTTHYKHWDKM